MDIPPQGVEHEELHEPVIESISRVVVLDGGGQYVDLIKKACERLGYPTDVLPIDTDLETIEQKYGAVFISGGPGTAGIEGHKQTDPRLWESDLPVFGSCLAVHDLVVSNGGTISSREYRNEGRITTSVDVHHPLFDGVKDKQQALFTHGNFVETVPEGFDVIAEHEKNGDRVITGLARGNKMAVQFHPEVFDDTPQGYDMIRNFFRNVTELPPDQEFLEEYMTKLVERKEAEIRERVGDKTVIGFISGGIDSLVAAKLAERVIDPDKLKLYYVDNGFMRDEDESVIDELEQQGFHVEKIEAAEEFENTMATLEDGTEIGPMITTMNPEHKRALMGIGFVRIEARIRNDLGLTEDDAVLMQGTNAADRIESGHSKGGGSTARIKLHHNMIPEVRELNPLEPIDDLFKNEVRELAVWLGIPEDVAYRHPFPGPGNSLRILGLEPGGYEEASEEEARIIREAVTNFASEHDLDLKAERLPVRNVGVGGDERSEIAAVAVEGEIDPEIMGELAETILSDHGSITNRMVYKIAGDPIDEMEPVENTTFTEEVRETQKAACRIGFEEMRNFGILRDISQMPVVMIPMGEDGEQRSIVLRPVFTETFMTARALLPEVDLPAEFFNTVANRILREVPGISHVFVDITDKPPGTIEWE